MYSGFAGMRSSIVRPPSDAKVAMPSVDSRNFSILNPPIPVVF
jgi:hypothetical protein